MTPVEILQRVMHARTPTIATDDALTVAQLHDLVIAWALAKEAYRRHPHAHELLVLRDAEHALLTVSGTEVSFLDEMP